VEDTRPPATCAINDVEALTRVCARAERLFLHACRELATREAPWTPAHFLRALRLWGAARQALALEQQHG